MADQLDNAQYSELMRERDSFKLALRGQTAIEADIDAAIADPFRGEVPGEVRSARFGIRLAQAVAFGLIPREMKGIFGRLANLRNDFAHGAIDDLTPQRARSIMREVRTALAATTRPTG